MVKMQLSDVKQVKNDNIMCSVYTLGNCCYYYIILSGIVCHDGDVRLVNGSQRHEGRIEICFNETWGTICNWISSYSWNHSQADVVCKQLGYSQAGKIEDSEQSIMMEVLV